MAEEILKKEEMVPEPKDGGSLNPGKTDDKRKDKKDKKGNGAKNALKTAGLAVLTNPKTYKVAGKLIAKIIALINSDEHWGGNSNQATGAIGPFIKKSDSRNSATLQYTMIKTGKLDAFINISPVKAKFNSLLEAFDKKLGFASGLTDTQVINYIGAAMDYHATITWCKKHYDAKRVSLVENVFFENLMTNLHGVHYTVATASTTDVSKNLFKKTVNAKIKYDNISNAVWSNDYVSEATDLYLMPQHIEMINYIYNAFFSNGLENGINAVLDVCPYYIASQLTESATYSSTSVELSMKTALDNARVALNTARSANRYITTFLTFLGFSTNNITSEMYYRDPTATSYIMKIHDDFIPALENMFNNYDETSDTNIIYRRTNDFDFTFDKAFDSITIGRIGELLKFNWLQASPMLYAGYTDEGTYADDQSVSFPISQQLAYTAWNTASVTLTNTEYNRIMCFGNTYNSKSFRAHNIFTWMGMMDIADHAEGVQIKITKAASATSISLLDISIQNISRSVDIYGSDSILVPNAGLMIEIAKVNFTLGRNYAKQLDDALVEIRKTLTIN